MLAELIKETQVIKSFYRDFVKGNISHAYIICGPDQVLRMVMASTIAKLLLCEFGGCDTCKTCVKLDNNSHIDVKYFNTDEKFNVKAAESLTEDTYIKGWESDIKLYFIDNADSLNAQSQNKLLKVYEEPPAGVIIFLMVSEEASLLKTIVSRAKKIYLPVFSTVEIAAELIERGITKSQAEMAAVFSGNRFDKAFKYAEEPEYNEIYERTFEILCSCTTTKLIAEFINDKIFSKESILVALEFIEIILRDVLEYTVGGNAFTTINRDFDIKTIAKNFNPGSVSMALCVIPEARRRLTANVGVTTVAEKLLFEILEAKYKWRL
ncbi:MAG: hypothetical protein LBU04_00980 [Christensenellaceae bacterium]|jgi:DNA polymerase-3 subunit delta'|nr:hypothetical protein [Christensenellaceae bacterium]